MSLIRPLYLYGAGGHGKVIAEAARCSARHRLRGFLDDDPARWGQQLHGIPVLGGWEVVDRLEPDAEVALALGANRQRARVAEALTGVGRRLATIVHPSAVVAAGVALGEGTYVAPLAVLHCDAAVGRGCIVNTGAIVEHDCVLEDWAHVSPRAALGGGVRLAEGAHVGLGAVLLPGVSVGAWAVLGAGAVLVCSLPGAVTAIGVPARVRAESGAPRRR